MVLEEPCVRGKTWWMFGDCDGVDDDDDDDTTMMMMPIF